MSSKPIVGFSEDPEVPLTNQSWISDQNMYRDFLDFEAKMKKEYGTRKTVATMKFFGVKDNKERAPGLNYSSEDEVNALAVSMVICQEIIRNDAPEYAFCKLRTIQRELADRKKQEGQKKVGVEGWKVAKIMCGCVRTLVDIAADVGGGISVFNATFGKPTTTQFYLAICGTGFYALSVLGKVNNAIQSCFDKPPQPEQKQKDE